MNSGFGPKSYKNLDRKNETLHKLFSLWKPWFLLCNNQFSPKGILKECKLQPRNFIYSPTVSNVWKQGRRHSYTLKDLEKKNIFSCILMEKNFIYLFIYVFFAFSRDAPVASGGSQARGWIGAVATSLCHSHRTPDPGHVWDLRPSSWQYRILNPLNKARDWTCILMGTSRVC